MDNHWETQEPRQATYIQSITVDKLRRCLRELESNDTIQANIKGDLSIKRDGHHIGCIDIDKAEFVKEKYKLSIVKCCGND